MGDWVVTRGIDRRHPGVQRTCLALPYQEAVAILCGIGAPVKIGRGGTYTADMKAIPMAVRDAFASVTTGGITRAEWFELVAEWRTSYPGTLPDPLPVPKMKPPSFKFPWCYHECGELRRRMRKQDPPCAVLQCVACGSYLGHDYTKTDAEIAELPPEIPRAPRTT